MNIPLLSKCTQLIVVITMLLMDQASIGIYVLQQTALHLWWKWRTFKLVLDPLISRGGKTLVHNNYFFSLKTKKNGRSYWNCIILTCPAKINTNFEYVAKVKGDHNHASDAHSFEAADIMSAVQMSEANNDQGSESTESWMNDFAVWKTILLQEMLMPSSMLMLHHIWWSWADRNQCFKHLEDILCNVKFMLH